MKFLVAVRASQELSQFPVRSWVQEQSRCHADKDLESLASSRVSDLILIGFKLLGRTAGRVDQLFVLWQVLSPRRRPQASRPCFESVHLSMNASEPLVGWPVRPSTMRHANSACDNATRCGLRRSFVIRVLPPESVVLIRIDTFPATWIHETQETFTREAHNLLHAKHTSVSQLSTSSCVVLCVCLVMCFVCPSSCREQGGPQTFS